MLPEVSSKQIWRNLCYYLITVLCEVHQKKLIRFFLLNNVNYLCSCACCVKSSCKVCPEILLQLIFQGCTTLQFSIMESAMLRQRVHNMIGMGQPTIAGLVLVDLTAITFTVLKMFQVRRLVIFNTGQIYFILTNGRENFIDRNESV